MSKLSLDLIGLIKSEIAAGYIKVTNHKNAPLQILNYAPKAQFEKRWNDATLMCRGLILDDNYNIIARPFNKFFNYTEVTTPKFVWNKPASIYDKLDGSLGIIYPFENQYHVATRGSFNSEQALWATDFLKNYENFSQPDNVTTLVEIIYPENRIVLDYNGLEDLILLGAINNDTGIDVPLWDINWWNGQSTSEHGLKTIDEAYQLGTGNDFESAEGIVAVWHFPNKPSYRLKIKHPEYVRLHRIITGVSNRNVWLYVAVDDLRKRGFTDKKALAKILRYNPEQIQEILDSPEDPLQSLLENVPDEFYKWVKETQAKLNNNFMNLYGETLQDFGLTIARFMDTMSIDEAIIYCRTKGRRYFKEWIEKHNYNSSLLFSLLDGKDIAPQVWNAIKPERQVPFNTQEDNEN